MSTEAVLKARGGKTKSSAINQQYDLLILILIKGDTDLYLKVTRLLWHTCEFL